MKGFYVDPLNHNRVTVTSAALVRAVLRDGGQLMQTQEGGWRIRAKGQNRTGMYLVNSRMVRVQLLNRGQILPTIGTSIWHLTPIGDLYEERHYYDQLKSMLKQLKEQR